MKNLNLITAALLFSIIIVSCEKAAVFEADGPVAPATTAGLAAAASPAAQNSLTAPDKEVLFNPQPEPPAQIFKFQTAIRRGGNWHGGFHNDTYRGRLEVETISSLKKGRTVHLVQSWTLFPEPVHPPEPVRPSKPVHPPEPVIPPTPMEPVTITLKGIYNTASGILVLNGKQAHVKGKAVNNEGGMLSFGGELMFNPQPEPPAVN